MEFWEFLIQKEGDRSWLPLESPESEILEGRYRVIVRSNRISAPVEIQINHLDTEVDPPKRRVHKRSSHTNQDGLMVVLPYTSLKPGLLEMSCTGDVMAEMLGDPWKQTVQLHVLSQHAENEAVDLWEPAPVMSEPDASEMPLSTASEPYGDESHSVADALVSFEPSPPEEAAPAPESEEFDLARELEREFAESAQSPQSPQSPQSIEEAIEGAIAVDENPASNDLDLSGDLNDDYADLSALELAAEPDAESAATADSLIDSLLDELNADLTAEAEVEAGEDMPPPSDESFLDALESFQPDSDRLTAEPEPLTDAPGETAVDRALDMEDTPPADLMRTDDAGAESLASPEDAMEDLTSLELGAIADSEEPTLPASESETFDQVSGELSDLFKVAEQMAAQVIASMTETFDQLDADLEEGIAVDPSASYSPPPDAEPAFPSGTEQNGREVWESPISLQLKLDHDTYALPQGQGFELTGMIETPDQLRDDPIAAQLPMPLHLIVRLTNPQNAHVLDEAIHEIEVQSLPCSWRVQIDLPAYEPTHLILGQVFLRLVGLATQDVPIASGSFTVTVDLENLLDAVSQPVFEDSLTPSVSPDAVSGFEASAISETEETSQERPPRSESPLPPQLSQPSPPHALRSPDLPPFAHNPPPGFDYAVALEAIQNHVTAKAEPKPDSFATPTDLEAADFSDTGLSDSGFSDNITDSLDLPTEAGPQDQEECLDDAAVQDLEYQGESVTPPEGIDAHDPFQTLSVTESQDWVAPSDSVASQDIWAGLDLTESYESVEPPDRVGLSPDQAEAESAASQDIFVSQEFVSQEFGAPEALEEPVSSLEGGYQEVQDPSDLYDFEGTQYLAAEGTADDVGFFEQEDMLFEDSFDDGDAPPATEVNPFDAPEPLESSLTSHAVSDRAPDEESAEAIADSSPSASAVKRPEKEIDTHWLSDGPYCLLPGAEGTSFAGLDWAIHKKLCRDRGEPFPLEGEFGRSDSAVTREDDSNSWNPEHSTEGLDNGLSEFDDREEWSDLNDDESLVLDDQAGALEPLTSGDLADESESSSEDTFETLNLQSRFLSRLSALASDSDQTDAASKGDGDSSSLDSMDSASWEVVVDDELPAYQWGISGYRLSSFQAGSPLARDIRNSRNLFDVKELPIPQIELPEEELIAGQLISVTVKLSETSSRYYVKLWIHDCQTRTIVDGPRWLVDFVTQETGEVQASTQLTVPFGCLEIQFEAIAVEMATQRESRKAIVVRDVIPPNLPTYSFE